MLIILPNLIFSQTINTNHTKTFSQEQISEIYKGLKQGDYLKVRLEKTEKTLKDADIIINEQKSLLDKKDLVINMKDDLINTNKLDCQKEKEILNIEINRLIEKSKLDLDYAKKDKRKNFWKGIKTGSVIGTILGAGVLILITK